MMKETHFGPLLLLLLLAVTPRNSSANPIASPDCGCDGTPTKYMKEGVSILIATMTMLQNNTLRSQLDDSILDLENKILSLPTHIAVNRTTILSGFYQQQTRLIALRTKLNSTATNLKDDCDTLITILNNNESSLGTIKYAAKQFVKYAKVVDGSLKEALTITININHEFSALKAVLKDFNARLEEETMKLEAAAIDIQQLNNTLENERQEIETMISGSETYTTTNSVTITKVSIITCIFTFGCDCSTFTIVIESQIMTKAVADRDELQCKMDDQQLLINDLELLNNIKPAHQSAKTLLSHVEDVKLYLEREIKLIINWRGHLSGAIADNDNISADDIEFNITGIKGSLEDLKTACDAYLANWLPGALQSVLNSSDD